VHIGQILKERLKADGKSVVWLARELGCHRTNVYNLFEKYSIDTQQLERISIIMHYNFFNLYYEDTERKIKEKLQKV
jgi:DNA invertase Pin-like site-specific DNA recombinase